MAAHIRGWHCTCAPVAELEWSWWWQKLLLEVANRLFESSCCLSLVGETLVVIKEGGDKNWGGIKTKGGSLGFSQEPKQRFNCVWEEKCENLQSISAPLTLARYRVSKCVLWEVDKMITMTLRWWPWEVQRGSVAMSPLLHWLLPHLHYPRYHYPYHHHDHR